MTKYFLPFLLMGALTMLGGESPKATVIFHSVINDTIPDAGAANSLAKCPNGDLIATFSDKGDIDVGCASYLVRSKDEGRTWSAPERMFLPAKDTEAVSAILNNLPDGRVLVTVERLFYKTNQGRAQTKSFSHFSNRTSRLELLVSTDPAARFFEPCGILPSPADALSTVTGNLLQLDNGDLLLPGYVLHPGGRYQIGKDGSGFWRSRDQGKSWEAFQIAVRDEPPEGEKPFYFNEICLFQKQDGTVVALSRHDSRPVRCLYRAESKDHGKTWSKAMPTTLQLCLPSVIRRPDGSFLLLGGNRSSRRNINLFWSKEGDEWMQIGEVYCSRGINGRNPNTAIGGYQRMVALPNNRILVSFYGFDATLKGFQQLYADSNIWEIR